MAAPCCPRKILFMRCATNHAVRWPRTGANVYDKDEFPEQQYERKGSPTMPYVVLAVLVAVVVFIAVLAARTGA